MVLDEPFTGLDALVRDELIEGLLAPRREHHHLHLLARPHGNRKLRQPHRLPGTGRLQFSEELESLTARFREVVLTFEDAPKLPPQLPPSWLQTQISGVVLRSVETQFEPERTAAEARRVFPDLRGMTVNAMPLRTIFVTLAKSARKAN